MRNKTPDWLIRTAKTAVQVFFGTLIPALCIALKSPPPTWAEVPAWLGSIFTPTLFFGDILASVICAVWNAAKEYKNEDN